MSREEEIMNALNEITEQSKSSRKEQKTNGQSVYDLLEQMNDDELIEAKKMVNFLIEKREGKRKRLKEQLGISEEKSINDMFTGLV